MRTGGEHIDLIRILKHHVEQAGASMDQLLSMSGLERISIKSERAEKETEVVALLQSAIELTKDPALPLLLGRNFDIGTMGTFGFAVMSCADINAYLRLMTRYQKTVGVGPGWRVLDHDRNSEKGMLARMIVTLGSSEQRRIVSELIFSQFCTAIEFLINGPLDGAELHLNYAPPNHSIEYQRLISTPVKFNQPYCQLVLPRQLLNRHVRTANPASHVIFLQQCEELLRNLNKVENTSAAVRRILLQSADFPNISQVAESLHVSERTLRRRLNGESTSFRALTEEIKSTLAQEYLLKTDITVSEIAHLLKYTEAVNFRQAFMRWQGVTPAQYRHSDDFSLG